MTADCAHQLSADSYLKGYRTGTDIVSAAFDAASGVASYQSSFLIPFLLSTQYFQQAEIRKASADGLNEVFKAYTDLGLFNLDLIRRSLDGAVAAAERYAQSLFADAAAALAKTFSTGNPCPLVDIVHQQGALLALVAHGYPRAIEGIADEFGFHFELGNHPLVDETERFRLYRVAPTKPGVEVQSDRKPILILPPYVLGANILGFLPQEERSYAHCFANQGIPTYIRILKDIATCEPLQTMSAEDDARDTRRFCETIRQRHAKAVTLNGYCQGGFNALCNLLSGELDGLVDAFITCVSPMDGTRSRGLSGFLKQLPARFNDLDYGTKTLPNGNRVADGQLMGWVYKLKSIETESPLAAYFRDLAMLNRTGGDAGSISKTAAALNYWLGYERMDLPLAITEMSFASFNTPIADDGTLPVRLFGKRLNLKRIKERGIPWLICYGIHDDLVEKDTALAPLDFVPAEVTPFPKGHVAIATSWSHPASACALHTRFGEGQHRGPVRFQLDLDETPDHA